MLEEGMEYTIDGDVVDSRNRIIQELKSQLANYRKRDYNDAQIRENNPAVQDAFDKYQTLLFLMR